MSHGGLQLFPCCNWLLVLLLLQMCTDGVGCKRRVCFFAHAENELRKPEEDPVWLQQQMQAEMAAGEGRAAGPQLQHSSRHHGYLINWPKGLSSEHHCWAWDEPMPDCFTGIMWNCRSLFPCCVAPNSCPLLQSNKPSSLRR